MRAELLEENTMKRISTAELKKAILAVEAERMKHPAMFQADRAQRAALQKNRQASDKMVYEFLKKAGLDLKKFKALQEQRDAEQVRMIAQHKKEALRLAAQRKDTLYSSVAAQVKALRDLVSRGGGHFPYTYPPFTLDNLFFIWEIPRANVISDSAVVPFGSWAKFKLLSKDHSGTQKVGFYFVWRNDQADYAVINATTFLSATGHLKAHAPWGFWSKTSMVGAWALLNLWLGGPRDVESTVSATKYLGGTGAFSSSQTTGTSISSGADLQTTTLFAVPPNTVVVFEVALLIEYEKYRS